MECDTRWGLLGAPEEMCYSDELICTVSQLFAAVEITVPATWARRSPTGCSPSELSVVFDGHGVQIRDQSDVILLQAHTWERILPDASTWRVLSSGDLRVALEKHPDHWCSWPHPFTSVAAACSRPLQDSIREPADIPALTQIHSIDKNLFNAKAEEALRIHLEDAAALRNAFAEAVALQLASVPSGPLGQRGFIFPFEGPHCLVYLQQTQHLPAVCKLLRLAHQHTACSLATLNARHAAPLACFLAGLAAVEEHRAVHGLPAVQGMTACCGFGASEYAAAVFAGVLRLNDALTALKVQMDALKLGKPLPDVVAAVHNALELADIRSPRVSLYSGASAAACSDTATLRWVLARAACSGPPSHEHRRQVCTALMQQGVAELVSLVPPKRDRMGDGRGEAQQSGDRERNSDSAGAVLDSVLACMSTSSESSTSESALEAVEGYTTS